MDQDRAGGNLVLVIDDDAHTRRSARALLEARGYEVVQASNALAALELVQRLPSGFRFVLTELDLNGLPGTALIEALRLFRPDLPVLCMSTRRAGSVATGCLTKPLDPVDLDAQIRAVRAGIMSGWEGAPGRVDEDAVARARERYSLGRDLVEAALELARGYTKEG
jgi:DNA-binding response OmpR family regulator